MQKIDLQEIQESGAFKSKAELIRFLILYILKSSQNTTGSWILNNQLNLMGVKTSLATVGRILKELDCEGLTCLEGNQGRAITVRGAEYLASQQDEIRKAHLNNQLLDSVKIDSVKQLIDLFHVRIIMEIEAVKLATVNANAKDWARLKNIVQQADANVDDLASVTMLNADFHKEIARIANNRCLSSMVDILMDEQWSIEDCFNVQQGYHNDSNARYHKLILEAMMEGNAEKGAKRMRQHLDALKEDALKSIQLLKVLQS